MINRHRTCHCCNFAIAVIFTPLPLLCDDTTTVTADDVVIMPLQWCNHCWCCQCLCFCCWCSHCWWCYYWYLCCWCHHCWCCCCWYHCSSLLLLMPPLLMSCCCQWAFADDATTVIFLQLTVAIQIKIDFLKQTLIWEGTKACQSTPQLWDSEHRGSSVRFFSFWQQNKHQYY